jgi:hypothetical protein
MSWYFITWRGAFVLYFLASLLASEMVKNWTTGNSSQSRFRVSWNLCLFGVKMRRNSKYRSLCSECSITLCLIHVCFLPFLLIYHKTRGTEAQGRIVATTRCYPQSSALKCKHRRAQPTPTNRQRSPRKTALDEKIEQINTEQGMRNGITLLPVSILRRTVC